TFENNIVMDCYTMWWTLKRPTTPEGIAEEWKGLERFGRDLPKGDKGDNVYITEQLIGEKGWLKSPWVDEYPELARAIETNPFAQTFGIVDRNYAYNVRNPFHIHGGSGTVEGMEEDGVGRFVDLPTDGRFVLPKNITLEAFVDVPSLNFNFKEGFEPMPGFRPIPFDDIGFVQDEFRPAPPDKATYRKQVYEWFKDERGGRYNPRVVNARYPEPSYLR
ncbi:MAG: right-handed parallel beta-helix repeat-containing protein, partial [bacterium]|nr:right-handed parallel beta-helix repeat-containing protein [bacterium]